jgi:cell division protease FtsH
VDEAHDEAWEILTTYREQLDRMVEVLLEKETIERNEVEEILSGVPKRSARGELISRPRRIKAPVDAAAAAAVAKNGDAPDTIEVSRPVVRPRPRAGTDPSPA